ncbi:hypothetical protein V2G26_018239 [Clonostachys chloroleuca]
MLSDESFVCLYYQYISVCIFTLLLLQLLLDIDVLISYIFPARLLTLFTTSRSPARSLTYWCRPHTSNTRLPVLFIHGIGIGLYPNIPFLADLNT